MLGSLTKVCEAANAVQTHQPIDWPWIEPHGPQRQRFRGGRAGIAPIRAQGWTDDRAARCDENMLGDAGTAADVDDLFAYLTGHKLIALAHAAAVGTDLFAEQVGV